MKPTRHELGQWFTPQPVADLALGLALRGAPAEAEILDPSCGDGVFLHRSLVRGIAEHRLFGVDIDARAVGAARKRVPGAAIDCCDFFGMQSEKQFDVIVGNPPYVRQERLDASAKTAILNRLDLDWPEIGRDELSRLIGRSDLAAPFLLRVVRQLRVGGRAAMVISSAFLDSAYGTLFWKILTKVASVELIVEAPEERWFQEAAVHTMIVVFCATPSSENICIARLRETTIHAASRVASGASIADVADLRYVRASSPETWAAALRAPDTWFRFVEAAGDALISLGDVADVRRGVTSGANDIFYLQRDQNDSIPESLLLPLLRSPGKGGLTQIEFESRVSSYVVLAMPPDVDLENYPAAQSYLAKFTDADTRPTLAARQPWWSLSVKPAQVFLSKAYAQRFVQPYSAEAVVADQRVYCIYPHVGVNAELLSAVLNATSTALAIESLGRASMGQGALEWTVADARKLPILDPRKITDASALCTAFAALRRRAIGRVGFESKQADRKALDEALLSTWPTLLPMQNDLVTALVGTCLARQARAKA